MKRISVDKVYKFLFIFAIIIVMNRASLFSKIHPFGIAVSFALLTINVNVYFIILSHAISNFVFSFSFQTLIIIAVEICAMFSLSLLKKRKKKLPNYLISLILLISESAKIYFSSKYLEDFLGVIACVFVSFVSFYIFAISFQAIKKRGKIFKFTIDEKLCHAVLIIAFFSGITNIYIGNFSISNSLAIAILFFVSRVSAESLSICFSTLAGLGFALGTSSIVPLALFSVWNAVMVVFRNNNKFITTIMVLASDCIVGIFLNVYGIYDLWILLSSFIGLLVVSFIRDKKLSTLANILGKHVDIAKDYALTNHEKSVNKKLKSLSNVFSGMENAYRSLLLGELEKSKAIEYISSNCKIKCCEKCEKYKTCYCGNIEIKSCIETLANVALGKGKVSFLDVPNIMSSTCNRISLVLSQLNLEAQSVQLLENDNKKKDHEHILVANQLRATGKMLNTISNNFKDSVNINYEKSNDLYEELLFNDIEVNDCVCLLNQHNIECIIISIPNNQVVNPNIICAIEKVFKSKFKLVERFMSNIAGYSLIVAKPEMSLIFSCGVSTSAKHEKDDCGDSYSISKLNDGKYFCAISDGMGSGGKASSLSNVTMSLIENYYQAGFDSDTVIESVNNLLLPASQDSFSTLDGVIVDTNNGRVDFIKIGATVSVVKGANESKIVECESLPLGITQNIKPTTQSVYMNSGDIIVLASDGVVDSFQSIEAYLHFINNERITNVQLLADNILEEARSRTVTHKDDMTVLAIKLANNY